MSLAIVARPFGQVPAVDPETDVPRVPQRRSPRPAAPPGSVDHLENTPTGAASATVDAIGAPPALRLAPPQQKAAPSVVTAAGDSINADQLYDRLAARSIIYVGETHTEVAHHQAQLAVIRGLHERGLPVAIGLEMMPYVDQPILDAFVAGRISEDELRAQWNSRWSWFDLYQPILRYAREHRIPLRGLNVPRAVISKIGAGGLEALTPAERATLPATVHPIEDPRYLAAVRQAIGGHGPISEEAMARRILAQTAWNEVMGEKALQALEGSPTHLVVLAGLGHMIYEAGIAESVRRRAGDRPNFSQAGVVPYPVDGPEGTEDELRRELQAAPELRQLGSFFWLTPAGARGRSSSVGR